MIPSLRVLLCATVCTAALSQDINDAVGPSRHRPHDAPSSRAAPSFALFSTNLGRYTSNNDSSSGVFYPAAYGADPTGVVDSTKAFQQTIDAAFAHVVPGPMIGGLSNTGGAVVDLQGGEYRVSEPLLFNAGGNLRLCCGSIIASDTFPPNSFIVSVGHVEDITIEDIAFECNHQAGAVATSNTLRLTLSRAFVIHFATVGVQVVGGHEVHVSNSFFGEYEWGEQGSGTGGTVKSTRATAIQIDGQDHWISDIIIFYSRRGIVLHGGALVLSNTHVYNNGDEALYVSGHAVRVLGCYFDFSPVVLVDPIAVDVSHNMFLGGVGVQIRSSAPGAIVSGLTVVHNQFVLGSVESAGPWQAVYLNTTAGAFGAVNSTVIAQNANPPATYGRYVGFQQTLRQTVLRKTLRQATATARWEFHLADELAFPAEVAPLHVVFSAEAVKGFPVMVLRPVQANGVVVVEAEVPFVGAVHIEVRQAGEVM